MVADRCGCTPVKPDALWMPTHEALLGGSCDLVVHRRWCNRDAQALGINRRKSKAPPGTSWHGRVSFEERVPALPIDSKVHARNDRKLVQRLKNADRKYG